MKQELIKEEIASILDAMRIAPESSQEYLIGQLQALLWVAGNGDVLRSVAFTQAVAAWDAMRKQQGPTS
ncbi:MAG: hypothetical protein ACOYNY_20375 [Caldilineaceae bacterium]|jgi:hypothetical protein